ncbi:hypothetical protein NPIL_249031, partial [Nephila pilipes]
ASSVALDLGSGTHSGSLNAESSNYFSEDAQKRLSMGETQHETLLSLLSRAVGYPG